MKYTSDYIGQIAGRLKEAPTDWLGKYQIDVDMKMPPLLEVVRVMDQAASLGGQVAIESKDRLLHFCITGRQVKVSYGGSEIGSFVSNSMADPWDNFPVLVENPAALRLLHELALTFTMEKWLPQPVSVPPAAAAIPASKK